MANKTDEAQSSTKQEEPKAYAKDVGTLFTQYNFEDYYLGPEANRGK
jgi:hypothetical protein